MGNKLTEREKDVLLCICEKGLYSRTQIAQKLFVEKSTIISHLNAIFKKTNTHCIEILLIRYYKGLL